MPAIRFETPRLLVRPHKVSDAEHYVIWDADPELAYLNEDSSDTYEPIPLDGARQYMRAIARQDPAKGIVHFGIEKKDSGALIGFSMVALIDPHHRRAMVGITIGERSEWGQGYAREAMIPLIDYCFGPLGLNRLIAEIYAFNTRSRRLFEKLGFKLEGTLRQSVWKRGQPIDDCVYALLAEDWQNHHP